MRAALLLALLVACTLGGIAGFAAWMLWHGR
jgi:hypothetical protein